MAVMLATRARLPWGLPGPPGALTATIPSGSKREGSRPGCSYCLLMAPGRPAPRPVSAGQTWARGRLTGALFQLLTVNPKHRVSSLQDMQAAPALAGVLWTELSEKKVEPGFVPNVSPQAQGGRGGRGWPGAGLSTVLHRKAACTATPPSSWRR